MSEKRSKVVSTRLTEGEMTRLMEIARREERKPADVIRRALKRYVLKGEARPAGAHGPLSGGSETPYPRG